MNLKQFYTGRAIGFVTLALIVSVALVFVKLMPPSTTPANSTTSGTTIRPVTLVDGEHFDYFGTFHDSAVVDNLKSYASDTLGVTLKYSDNYLLFENEPTQEDQTGVYQNFQTIVIGPKEPVLQTIARARAGFAGEGPYTITLSFFYVPEIQNRETNMAPLDYLKQWLTDHQGQSNFYPEGQGPGTVPATLTPTTIAKVPALRYRNEYGMYESDNIALVHDDRIIILSAPTDPSIHGDFETMLSNIKLSK